LPELAALGVTTVELLPVGAFAGSRGWGYDGVALYAPHAPYGSPDELRAFVDAAHGLGLGVLNFLPLFKSNIHIFIVSYRY
jgi:maltooligosyltrehalose trehalohydrolase